MIIAHYSNETPSKLHKKGGQWTKLTHMGDIDDENHCYEKKVDNELKHADIENENHVVRKR